jgi:hypothetical protein
MLWREAPATCWSRLVACGRRANAVACHPALRGLGAIENDRRDGAIDYESSHSTATCR